MLKNLEKRICPSLTGINERDWKRKIEEINELGLSRVAVILESYEKKQREKIYEALENSTVKEIPLVHLRNDMSRDELEYLRDRFQGRYLTIHEDSFSILEKWHRYYKNLFLELNFDNRIPANVAVEKIGGFCIDLAHFKVAEEKWSKEFEYTMAKRGSRKFFACNHLSGYNAAKNIDQHKPKTIAEFEYVKTLPEFLFGEVIAIEVYNPIREQLEFKKRIIALLAGK